jgi:6-pyruvoyltetrahydropterin/6-carboxytetrahydropterin synthase
MKIYKEFTFDAAHWLPLVPEGHKCKRMHGHTYVVRLWLSGPVAEDGMIVDYADIASAFEPVFRLLDHQCLNDVIANPTTENLATYIQQQLIELPALFAIEIKESSSTGCYFEWELSPPVA